MLILKGLIGGLFQLALFGAFLVVPARLVPGGTWYWPRALIFIGVCGFILEATIVALAVVAPASLEARLRAPASKKQPAADRVLTAFLILSFLAWFVSIPIEVFILIARIAVEEKMLRKTLPGYPEYMEKVRYRLVPFVW